MSRSTGWLASLHGLGRAARATPPGPRLRPDTRRRPPLRVTSRLTVDAALPSPAAIARIEAGRQAPGDLLPLGQAQPARRPTPRRQAGSPAAHQIRPHRARDSPSARAAGLAAIPARNRAQISSSSSGDNRRYPRAIATSPNQEVLR